MRTLVLSLMALFMVTACSSHQLSGEKPEVPRVNILGEYIVGVGDQLRVDVWKNPDITMNVPVRPDGNISLPLIGDIRAQGYSASELAKNISDKLEVYIRSPQVTVIVTDAGSVDYLLRVRVTGAVNHPLSIPHKDGMTVLDLVLEAGGPTQYASSNKAKLYRKVNGEVKVYPIKLNDILNKGKLETNYALVPSDIVTIPERLF